jgi:hypothetical protein
MVAWAKNGYAFKSDRAVMLKVIAEGWSIPKEAAKALLSGEVEYEVVGEVVEFEYEGEEERLVREALLAEKAKEAAFRNERYALRLKEGGY